MRAPRPARRRRLLLIGPVVLLAAAAGAARLWWRQPLRRLRRRADRLGLERAFRLVGEDRADAYRYLGVDTPHSLTRSYTTALTVEDAVLAARRHLRSLGYGVRVEHRDAGVELSVRQEGPPEQGSARVAVSKQERRTLIELTCWN
jgi:hypothetical protein